MQLAYIAPQFSEAKLSINLQLLITIPEASPLNMIAPPKLEYPFTNVMSFNVTLFEASMQNILDWPAPLISKPLPLMVIGFFYGYSVA